MKRFWIVFISMISIGLSASAQSLELGTTTALVKVPSTDNFKLIKANGIRWVEVALNQCYRKVPKKEVDQRIAQMKWAIDSAGVKVWSVHLPFSKTLDISVLNDSARESNVHFLMKMMKTSQAFSPSRFVLHSSSEPIPDNEREQRLQNAIASIRQLNHIAKKLGIELCIENLPRTCLGNTPEELVRIVDSVKGVKVCFDTNHYLKGSTDHFLDIVGNRIHTVHCSDYDYQNERHWLPTQGSVDWKTLYRRLYDNGYRGIFMYEAVHDRSNNNSALSPKQLVDSYHQIIFSAK